MDESELKAHPSERGLSRSPLSLPLLSRVDRLQPGMQVVCQRGGGRIGFANVERIERERAGELRLTLVDADTGVYDELVLPVHAQLLAHDWQ